MEQKQILDDKARIQVKIQAKDSLTLCTVND